MNKNRYNYRILRRTDDNEMIELKSRFHYWRLVKIRGTNQYVLSHKHKKKDEYHKQNIRNHSYFGCFSYIAAHDNYVAALRKQ